MSDFESLPMSDERERPLKDTEYLIDSVGVGKVICSRPGVRLIDFYRTSTVLASECEKHGEAMGRVAITDRGGATPPLAATPEDIKNNQ